MVARGEGGPLGGWDGASSSAQATAPRKHFGQVPAKRAAGARRPHGPVSEGLEAAYLSRLRRELRAIRRGSQLTQEGLARQLTGRTGSYYDHQAVNSWEWGQDRPPVLVWLGYLKIAADMGLDPVALTNRVLGRPSA